VQPHGPRDPAAPSPVYSVVVPVFNEAPNVQAVYARVSAALRALERPHELIFVDDGSTDETASIVGGVQEQDSAVRLVSLSRNFGHPVALAAGLDHAHGDFVFLTDGDLQDPPEAFAVLLAKLSEGHDLVYAVRSRSHASRPRRILSRAFWAVISSLSGYDIPSDQLVLRVMTRRYADALRSLQESSRFWGGLFCWVGFSQASVPVAPGRRYAGRSKYSISKLARLTVDAALSFSHVPLQLAVYLGLTVSAVSFAAMLVIIAARLALGIMLVGWLSLMVAVLFMGGVQLTFMGVLGVYLGRVYGESMRRPLYIVKDVS
jgi:polyisoprenyl-phosphate glycosyltransferase